jgi:xanthine dehydrogenase accessory factor
VRTRLIDGWLVEPVAAAPLALWLYGAGHVGRAIVSVLADLPVAITWVDDATQRFPPEIPPQARRLLAADPARAVAHAPDTAHHLVLTYSHALDLALCHAILQRRFASLGLIGSATKRARFLKRLGALGYPPERLARLTCPIGDPALGKHPQAIAISVAHRLLLDAPACAQGRNEDIA